MTSARYVSSVCSSRITSAWTTLTPASIIVAICRAKICSDFGLTFLNLPTALPTGGLLCQRLRQQAARRSCSRAAAVSGAWISPVTSRPWTLIAL